MKYSLEQLQNPDGGWPYGTAGPSWTEPTAMALLALLARGAKDSAAIGRGVQWLRAAQSADGGWPAQPGVPGSTWVGALVGLLPATLIGKERQRVNIEWILNQTGEESTWSYRVRRWLIAGGRFDSGQIEGWAWYPGAAAWVTPTSLTILALERQRSLFPNSLIDRRIQAGRRYLLAHACAGGGWNHGSAESLGYAANAYPETTGTALLALHGVDSPVKEAGLRKASEFLSRCRTAEACSWLSLGLSANGRDVQVDSAEAFEPRTTVDTALCQIARSVKPGVNPFV